MKNLILPLMILLCSFSGMAQDTYFVLEGRSSALYTVEQLAQNLNATNYPIYARSNESLGNVFTYSLINNGKIIASERIHLSNAIILSIQRHLSNPQSGESLMSVCGTQGGQFLRVNNRGSELFKREIEDLVNLLEKKDPLVNGDTQQVGLDGPGTTYISPTLLKYNFTSVPSDISFTSEKKKKERGEKTFMGKYWPVAVGLIVAGVGTYMILEADSNKPPATTVPGETWPGNTNSIVLVRF